MPPSSSRSLEPGSGPRFILSLNALAALNAGAFEAGIATASPVRGFLPVRASRFRVPKVPNPAIRTASSLARDSPIASNTVSTAAAASALRNRSLAATRLLMSALFIPRSLQRRRRPARAKPPDRPPPTADPTLSGKTRTRQTPIA